MKKDFKLSTTAPHSGQSLARKSRPKGRVFWFSLIFVSVILLLAIFAPWVTRFSYDDQDIAYRLATPDAVHWMGTDNLGRDLFSRIIYGARMSLTVGIVTTLAALVVGTLVGAVAGYRGGLSDLLLMRLADLFYMIPTLLLAILISMVFGRGIFGILLALSISAWVTQARLVRAQVLQTKELPFVESARAIGVTGARIFSRHILPNLWGPILVSVTLQIPQMIMAESFLSFIGLGLRPPYSSWGTLANEGFRAMRSFPHLVIFPGAVLFLTLLCMNYLGDGLRDWFDPNSSATDRSL